MGPRARGYHPADGSESRICGIIYAAGNRWSCDHESFVGISVSEFEIEAAYGLIRICGLFTQDNRLDSHIRLSLPPFPALTLHHNELKAQ